MTLAKKSYAYTGKPLKPAVKSVTLNGKKLLASDYSVSYTNNKKPGKATVTVTGKVYDFRVRAVAGKSKSAWSAVKHCWFAKQTGVRTVSRKAGTVRVNWAKIGGANAGYKVVVRYSKTGKAVAVKNVKANKTNVTIKGLKPGKRAWVQVRPLRKAGGESFAGITGRSKNVVKIAGKSKKAQSASLMATTL